MSTMPKSFTISIGKNTNLGKIWAGATQLAGIVGVVLMGANTGKLPNSMREIMGIIAGSLVGISHWHNSKKV